jgi:hypothetical protein
MYKYKAAKSKLDKTTIVMGIVDSVREASGVGGFVRQNPDTKRWFEVGDHIAREKGTSAASSGGSRVWHIFLRNVSS